MRVAAGTIHREREQTVPQHFDRVVQHSVVIERDIAFGFVGLVAGRAEVTGGNQVFANLVGESRSMPPIHQLVARQLLDEKAVVRLVGVEGADHVVAILPLAFADEDAVCVRIESNRVRIADDVQPVPPPSLAKAGRRQEPIDLARERVGRGISQELGEFFRRRRQAVQIEKGPPEQSCPVGRRRETETARFQLLQQKGVDRCRCPHGVSRNRHRGPPHVSKRPMFLVAGRDFGRFVVATADRAGSNRDEACAKKNRKRQATKNRRHRAGLRREAGAGIFGRERLSGAKKILTRRGVAKPPRRDSKRPDLIAANDSKIGC